jgi:hypothetical protein
MRGGDSDNVFGVCEAVDGHEITRAQRAKLEQIYPRDIRLCEWGRLNYLTQRHGVVEARRAQ